MAPIKAAPNQERPTNRRSWDPQGSPEPPRQDAQPSCRVSWGCACPEGPLDRWRGAWPRPRINHWDTACPRGGHKARERPQEFLFLPPSWAVGPSWRKGSVEITAFLMATARRPRAFTLWHRRVGTCSQGSRFCSEPDTSLHRRRGSSTAQASPLQHLSAPETGSRLRPGPRPACGSLPTQASAPHTLRL